VKIWIPWRLGYAARAAVTFVALLGGAAGAFAACGGTTGIEEIPMEAGAAQVADAFVPDATVDQTVADEASDAANPMRPPPNDAVSDVVSLLPLPGPDAGDGGAEAGGSVGPHPFGTPLTYSALAPLGPDCLWCMTQNGCFDPTQANGTCEDQALFMGLDPTPSQYGNTYQALCVNTLGAIVSSGCPTAGQELSCICTSVADAGPCESGQDTPTGPLVPYYLAAFPCPQSVDEATCFIPKVSDQTYAAGEADVLIQCAAAFACASCFGSGGTPPPPSTDAGSGGTRAVLAARGSDCLACADQVGCLTPQYAGPCEQTPGLAALPPADGGAGQTCRQLFGAPAPTEAQVCTGTLAAILGWGCSADPRDIPACLCGSSSCLIEGTPVSGPVAPYYACESIPSSSAEGLMDQSFGVGQATALAQCLGAEGCTSCFAPYNVRSP
jgi:hypothetical protein